jgi:cytochrome c oxidase cbb3-type subunit III
MRRVKIRAVAAAILGILITNYGLAQQREQKGAETSRAVSVAAGRQTFSSICASCHGLDGRGGERGPDIANRPEIAGLTDGETLKVLRAGIPEKGMPMFAELGSAKLLAVLSYLRTLQGKDAQAQAPGHADKGKELFSGKAGCSTCHMVNGSGGFLGPELSGYGGNHNAAEIRAAILNPRERADGRHRAAELIATDGKSYSGIVRNEDNFSVQLQSSDGIFHLFSKSDVAAIHYRKEPLMPADYGSKLSAAEVDALAAYLFQVAHAKAKP